MPVEDLSDFSGTVPVFPLPNVVLFPSTVLPLHIFEPRYRTMTERALEGERLIAMSLLKLGWEKTYEGSPTFHDIVTIGRITQEQRRPDGRFDLMLLGLSRARVVEIVGENPYRTARVELLTDRDAPPEEEKRHREAILAGYTRLLGRIQAQQDEKLSRMLAGLPLGLLGDSVAALLPAEPAEKQAVLEILDVAARAERVTRLIAQAEQLIRDALDSRRRPVDPYRQSMN